jgi:16S rRNA (uracil1498-N3)-methyltransferase
MNLPRFHCPSPLAAGERLELHDELAHHAVRVRRLRDGSDIALFDGRGGFFPATLEIQGKKAWAQLGARVEAECELPCRLVLVQGIASADKMDWVIEKAVEMGVSEVVPIAAHRSVIQLSGERREKRLGHWRRIAVSASEQCGRNRIMDVAEPCSLADWLSAPQPGLLRLGCHPDAGQSLRDAVAPHEGPLALLVGPEGGWSEEELSLMHDQGIVPVRFGQRVLRTETAGIALAAAVTAIKAWDE